MEQKARQKQLRMEHVRLFRYHVLDQTKKKFCRDSVNIMNAEFNFGSEAFCKRSPKRGFLLAAWKLCLWSH